MLKYTCIAHKCIIGSNYSIFMCAFNCRISYFWAPGLLFPRRIGGRQVWYCVIGTRGNSGYSIVARELRSRYNDVWKLKLNESLAFSFRIFTATIYSVLPVYWQPHLINVVQLRMGIRLT